MILRDLVPRSVRRFVAQVLWPPIRHFLFEDGFVVAGFVAFTALFAIFPFLMFLLTVAGYLGQGQAASESITLALEVVPPEVAYVLEPAIDDIRSRATPGLTTFTIFLALWFASSGMEAIRHALERAYGITESRHYVVNRLQSLALTILTAVGILVATIAIVAGPAVKDTLEWLAQRELFQQSLYLLVRYVLALLLLLGVTLLLHTVLPRVKLRLGDVLPGALVSVVAWALVATLYSVYLRNFAAYSVTYGSLGGIILTLFFFYVSSLIFIFGAQLNGSLRRWRHRPTTGRDTSAPSAPSGSTERSLG